MDQNQKSWSTSARKLVATEKSTNDPSDMTDESRVNMQTVVKSPKISTAGIELLAQ